MKRLATLTLLVVLFPIGILVRGLYGFCWEASDSAAEWVVTFTRFYRRA